MLKWKEREKVTKKEKGKRHTSQHHHPPLPGSELLWNSPCSASLSSKSQICRFTWNSAFLLWESVEMLPQACWCKGRLMMATVSCDHRSSARRKSPWFTGGRAPRTGVCETSDVMDAPSLSQPFLLFERARRESQLDGPSRALV